MSDVTMTHGPETLDPQVPKPTPNPVSNTEDRFYLERKVIVRLETPLVPAVIPMYPHDKIAFPFEVVMRWHKNAPEHPWTQGRIEVHYHPRLKDRSIGKAYRRLDVYGDQYRKRKGAADMSWLAKIVDAHTPTTETELIEREPLTKPSKEIPRGATGQRSAPVEHDGTPEATERILSALARR